MKIRILQFASLKNYISLIALTPLFIAAPLFADQPDSEQVVFTELFNNGDCGDFEVFSLDAFTLDIKTFYKGGEIDRIHYHASVDGIVYNSLEPSKQLPSTAHYNFVHYPENFNLFVQRGLFYRVNVPGGGVVLIDAGWFIVELIDDEPVVHLEAGNHQLLDGDLTDLCAALQ